MVQYRSFRNTDPPRLVEVWNEAFIGRSAVELRGPSALERHVFAKPYFDPAGLIVAEENRVPVGFVHAGFGPNQDETGLATATGVTCLLAVRLSHRRKGIGAELLRLSEEYLRGKGAQTLLAGSIRPYNPFYFGLYGGSDLPGFLVSDTAAGPFFLKRGYQPVGSCLAFQRRLDHAVSVVDPRFANLRKQYDVRIVPRIGVGSWWQESTVGLVEPVEFRLEEKGTSQLAGRAIVWEMEGYSWRWNLPAVGILDVQIRENFRRQGMAKHLLSQILRYLQDQFFGLVEMQSMEANPAALGLLQSLGFEQVDKGQVFKKV